MKTNVLYYGDNLEILRRYIPDESIDLVYLDPPFNSNANYNILFDEHGTKAAAQIEAFGDTWVWDTQAAATYQDTVEAGGDVAKALLAFRTLLGTSDMLAYLSMMAPRLVELRRILRSTGSLYLHCDPTASHYLKVLLDAVFGPKAFIAEVIWRRTNARGTTGRWPRLHDTILQYARSATFEFHAVRVVADQARMPHTLVTGPDGLMYQSYELTAPGATRDGESGRPWHGFDPSKYARHWANSAAQMDAWDANGLIHWPSRGGWPRRRAAEPFRHEDRHVVVGDVWSDIDRINQTAKERLGYPTQKPVALMERIVSASSRPGDVVLDPFCGCGTTIDAAQALGRRWIGIDITHLAIGLIKHRLVDRYGPEIADTYRVVGEPTTLEDAAVLAQEDPFQFQAWALGLVGARVAGSDKKGGDRGIDGRLYFHDSADGQTRQIVFSVKAGERLAPTFVRDLRGVVDGEHAEIGVLITFKEPTAGMRAEAASAGFYTSPWGNHPRLQLRTVGQLLAGQGIDYPHVTGANVTHRRAARATGERPEALELFPTPSHEQEQ